MPSLQRLLVMLAVAALVAVGALVVYPSFASPAADTPSRTRFQPARVGPTTSSKHGGRASPVAPTLRPRLPPPPPQKPADRGVCEQHVQALARIAKSHGIDGRTAPPAREAQYAPDECVLEHLPCPADMADIMERVENATWAMTMAVAEGGTDWRDRLQGGSYMTAVSLRLIAQLANLPWVHTYCESGFNGGHSLVAALAANPSLRAMSIGLLRQPDSLKYLQYIMKHPEYHERAHVVHGSIYHALAVFGTLVDINELPAPKRCDVLFADAHGWQGHRRSWVPDEFALWRDNVLTPDNCHIAFYENARKYYLDDMNQRQWEALRAQSGGRLSFLDVLSSTVLTRLGHAFHQGSGQGESVVINVISFHHTAAGG